MKTKNVSLAFKRKREGKTNYKTRLQLLLGKKPRLVIRKSLKHTIAQIVVYAENGDSVLATAHSNMLKKQGWNLGTGNLPAAYLTGYMLGVAAKGKTKDTINVDLGMAISIRGSRLYAVVRGAKEAGLDIACADDMLPGDDRIYGVHMKPEVKQAVESVKKKLGGSSEKA